MAEEDKYVPATTATEARIVTSLMGEGRVHRGGLDVAIGNTEAHNGGLYTSDEPLVRHHGPENLPDPKLLAPFAEQLFRNAEKLGARTQEQQIPEFLRQPETIFDEAKKIIYGDREQTYGHPSKNFDATAALWTAHLKAKYGNELVLDAEDVAWMMVQLKQARNMHQYKRDNLVDAAGYIGCIQKMEDCKNAEEKAQSTGVMSRNSNRTGS